MNDNQKVMRVHVREDKSFKVSAKKKDILLLVTVVQTYYTIQHRADWIEANRTRDLIIHDSTRNPNSVIVSLYIFLRLRLSLYDFDTYEMNSLTACLNSFLFLKCSFFGSLFVSHKDDIFAICRSNSCKINWPEITCIYIKTERHTAYKSKTLLTCDSIISFHPGVPSKINQKSQNKAVANKYSGLGFKNQYETLKLYTVLSLNDKWISTQTI